MFLKLAYLPSKFRFLGKNIKFLLGNYLTIRPVARGEAEWAIDPWPLRAKGLIVLVSPN